MQTWLALVMIGRAIIAIVMMMIRFKLIILMMATMRMIRLIYRVHVQERARECPDGGCEDRTNAGRDRKYSSHRPNENGGPSICSVHPGQHRSVRLPQIQGYQPSSPA